MKGLPQPPTSKEKNQGREIKKIEVPKTMWIVGLAICLSLGFFIYYHVAEAEELVRLLSQISVSWIALALAFQLGTYLCAGAIWKIVTVETHHHLSLSVLARLAIEKLSINQLLPAGGLSGNVVVMTVMRHLGLPSEIALEAMLINTLGYYGAFMIVTLASLFILWLYNGITVVVLYLVGAFCLFLMGVLFLMWRILKHKGKALPLWLIRFKTVSQVVETLKNISSQRILSLKLLGPACLLSIAVFCLDSATLWTMMQAIHTPISIVTAFATLVIASVAGTVSFMPGGLGGFEAGSVAILKLLGIPLEAALTGVLLLRGLTLWIPLLPGLILARRDLKKRVSPQTKSLL